MTDNEIKLLKECNLGSKMAVNSIRRVYDSAKSDKLKKALDDTLSAHEALGDRLHELLEEAGLEPKEPNFMEQSSVVMSIGMKMMVDPSDKKIAEIMTDGCDMGIKKVQGYINELGGEDKRVIQTAEKLIKNEENFRENLRAFL